VKQLTDFEIGYIAGIIDGEGSIGAYRSVSILNNKEYINVVVQVSNTDLAMMEWLSSILGGKLYSFKCKGGRKQAYKWSRSGTNVIPVLELVLPHLKIKKRQAELALAFAKTVDPSSYRVPERDNLKRIILADKLSELNQRGNEK
jgi:hypothetical protein